MDYWRTSPCSILHFKMHQMCSISPKTSSSDYGLIISWEGDPISFLELRCWLRWTNPSEKLEKTKFQNLQGIHCSFCVPINLCYSHRVGYRLFDRGIYSSLQAICIKKSDLFYIIKWLWHQSQGSGQRTPETISFKFKRARTSFFLTIKGWHSMEFHSPSHTPLRGKVGSRSEIGEASPEESNRKSTVYIRRDDHLSHANESHTQFLTSMHTH